jgi:hypothetical protein
MRAKLSVEVASLDGISCMKRKTVVIYGQSGSEQSKNAADI